MKKYIYGVFMALASVAMFTACSADEGTEPGNDGQANVLIYQYTADTPNDADVDTQLRITTNSATDAAYILAEPTEDYESRVSSLSESGYQDYVVENGKKLDKVQGEAVVDTIIKNLAGDYTITVVAVGKGGKISKKVNFVGVTWSDVASGTYYFSDFGQLFSIEEQYGYSLPATLQVCDSDPTQYRFKDFWKAGYHFKFNLTGKSGTLASGAKVNIITVEGQKTPYTYGSYGTIYFADALTHQDANAQGYIREDNVVLLPMSYYVEAGTLLDITGYDRFIPNAE